ncbi:cytochrome P450 [Planotetraspora sp. GP83]|uniref:cytochrome P450 n=1 Tax=Planotetraspora sp. GP83 TaxID=3156264 RepID=UPI003516B47C
MTNPSDKTPARCPMGREPLFSDAFHADPAAVFRRLRETYGSVAPVQLAPGVPAFIILDYQTMLAISRDTATWSHDSRLWAEWNQGRIPDDSELLPMMMYRPNLLFADGAEHARLRRAVDDGLHLIDLRILDKQIRIVAHDVIDTFATRGVADLVAEYATQVPLRVFNHLLGLDERGGQRLVNVLRRIWDGSDAVRAGADLERFMGNLVAAKRRNPGPDITSALLDHHANMGDEELIHHLVILIGAGNAPTADLIGNALRVLLTDRETGSAVAGARISINDAIHHVLWWDTPMQTYPFVYPRRDVRIGSVTIPEGAAVGMGLAASNLSVVEGRRDLLASNRAHVSFGVGPHRCPASDLAVQIATTAIGAVLHRLPGLHLDVPPAELTWRPSLFARALTALPVRFVPTDPDLWSSPNRGHHSSAQEGTQWHRNDPASSWTPGAATSTNRPRGSARTARSPWWSFLVRSRRTR